MTIYKDTGYSLDTAFPTDTISAYMRGLAKVSFCYNKIELSRPDVTVIQGHIDIFTNTNDENTSIKNEISYGASNIPNFCSRADCISFEDDFFYEETSFTNENACNIHTPGNSNSGRTNPLNTRRCDDEDNNSIDMEQDIPPSDVPINYALEEICKELISNPLKRIAPFS